MTLKKQEERHMGTVDVREYLNKHLENKDFKMGYTEELDKLLSSVAIMRAREEMGHTQKELAEENQSSSVHHRTHWKRSRYQCRDIEQANCCFGQKASH